MPLEQYLPFQVHVFLIVFARIGGLVYFFPSVGETYVSSRIRLMFAMALTFVIVPLVNGYIPDSPPSAAALLALVFGEFVIGIFFGIMARTLLLTMDTTGRILSFSIGFANAQVFNPAVSQQGTLSGLLLTIIGVMVIIATNMHHMLIIGIIESYSMFQPGGRLPFADFSEHYMRMVATSFKIAVQLATPFIVFSLMFFVSLGMVARLMPQLQVFFIGLPIQIYVGLTLLAGILTALFGIFVRYYTDNITAFLIP